MQTIGLWLVGGVALWICWYGSRMPHRWRDLFDRTKWR